MQMPWDYEITPRWADNIVFLAIVILTFLTLLVSGCNFKRQELVFPAIPPNLRWVDLTQKEVNLACRGAAKHPTWDNGDYIHPDEDIAGCYQQSTNTVYIVSKFDSCVARHELVHSSGLPDSVAEEQCSR